MNDMALCHTNRVLALVVVAANAVGMAMGNFFNGSRTHSQHLNIKGDRLLGKGMVDIHIELANHKNRAGFTALIGIKTNHFAGL